MKTLYLNEYLFEFQYNSKDFELNLSTCLFILLNFEIRETKIEENFEKFRPT